MNELPFSEHDGHVVIQLPNHLDQNDWMSLRDLINRQFVDRGMNRIIVDCEQCANLPSIAFGTFTSLSRDLHRMRGSLHLVHVSERIRVVLTRTRMDGLLAVHGTLTEVIRKREPGPR
jgi:anti-anti-sigma factor